MQATAARTTVRTLPIAQSERRLFARVAGVIGLVTFAAIVTEHVGVGLVAGQRISGTSDVQAITAFYGHRAMLPFLGLGLGFIGLIAFPVAFRAYLRTFELSPLLALVVDVATLAAFAEAPLIAVQLGLQAALVQVVAAGSGGVLPLFAAWDWIYNSGTYWFEATWMLAWAAVAMRSRALPRWIAITGGLAGAGLLLNSTVLFLGIPDVFTLIPTAVFAVWFVATGIHLLRGGTAGLSGN